MNKWIKGLRMKKEKLRVRNEGMSSNKCKS